MDRLRDGVPARRSRKVSEAFLGTQSRHDMDPIATAVRYARALCMLAAAGCTESLFY